MKYLFVFMAFFFIGLKDSGYQTVLATICMWIAMFIKWEELK